MGFRDTDIRSIFEKYGPVSKRPISFQNQMNTHLQTFFN